MSDQPMPTTAAAMLNDFRRELFDGGYTVDQIGDLAKIALQALFSVGCELIVRERVTA